MKVLELECPACRVKLRLKDRLQQGRTFGCPDCARDLILVQVAGTFEVTLHNKSALPSIAETNENSNIIKPPTQKKQTPSNKPGSLTSTQKLLQNWLADPWTVAWLLALGFTFLFIRIVLWPRPVPSYLPQVNQQQVENPPARQDPPELIADSKMNQESKSPATGRTVIPQDKPSTPNMMPATPENIAVTPPDKKTIESPQVEPQPKVIALEEFQADGTMKQATSTIQLQETLSLTIKKYQQKVPLPANVLLVELEPLTGVEIQTRLKDQEAQKVLSNSQIQLPEQENVTVKKLLELIAQELGLEMVLGDQVIYFQSLEFQEIE